MAKNNPDSEVVGLDIVSDALESNRSRVNKEGIKNLSFVNYDGIDFPFEDQSFDLVVTRYTELLITEHVNNLLYRKNGPMEGMSDEG